MNTNGILFKIRCLNEDIINLSQILKYFYSAISPIGAEDDNFRVSCIQNLQQKVVELEHIIDDKNKVIENQNLYIQDIKTKMNKSVTNIGIQVSRDELFGNQATSNFNMRNNRLGYQTHCDTGMELHYLNQAKSTEEITYDTPKEYMNLENNGSRFLDSSKFGSLKQKLSSASK